MADLTIYSKECKTDSSNFKLEIKKRSDGNFLLGAKTFILPEDLDELDYVPLNKDNIKNVLMDALIAIQYFTKHGDNTNDY